MSKPSAVADLTVNGLSLWSLGTFEEFSGALASQPRRGSNYTLPGSNGEVAVTRPWSAYEVSCGVTILSMAATASAAMTDLASKISSLDVALSAASFTVVKKVGTFSKSATATDGRYDVTLVNPWTARATVSFRVVTRWA